MTDWKTVGQAWVYRWIDPFIKLLIRRGITPNMVTFIGLLINVIAAVVLIYGAEKADRNDHRVVGLAGAIILFAGLFDMIDGRLARLGKSESVYGALYDSVLDRYSELFMFLGICYYLVANHYFLSSLFAFIAMIGSVMVSYTRARAEGLGIKMADVGFMQRPERILTIGISAIICGIMSGLLGSEYKITVSWLPFPLVETISFFTFPVFLLAVFSNITAYLRLKHAKTLLNTKQ
ncbi:MAG: CDP-alcohol phosphatidyltransferase family protein [Saprospiraceae bacterium]|jgi:CDP-diacylglycerol--glycerol-3-phosphate 3-phosphatidyltransferase|nr:CDP-alcohol phosphatidyltransferase family protein [Saprospiraceae bacterium]MBK9567936.1 CDP-alcohol phosphatidyltransferase family protein [Saprospiraceae bacterium]MBP6447865.1 CDP-alcohol phosphatidyltransferase family protein [Saprospiraceae bacterium]MBP9196369.1 CDP-alcohol phosphatidyltransferase family protein [Saprospiraceae bacterium]